MARPWKVLRGLLSTVASVAVLTLSGTADARLISGAFDPAVFSGDGVFFVPDTPDPCSSLSAGFHLVNLGFTSCNGVTLDSVSTTVNDGLGDTAHLSLPSPSSSIFGLVIDPASASYVVGVDSGLIPLSVGSCNTLGPDDLCDYTWFIQWLSVVFPTHTDPLHGLTNAVVLYRQSCEEEEIDSLFVHEDCTKQIFGSPATHVAFNPAPEPGSLALIGAAVAAGLLARRRSRKPSAC